MPNDSGGVASLVSTVKVEGRKVAAASAQKNWKQFATSTQRGKIFSGSIYLEKWDGYCHMTLER